MNKKKESLFVRFLKRIGIIKTYEISKGEMCRKAQSVCSHNCDSCAWNEQDK